MLNLRKIIPILFIIILFCFTKNTLAVTLPATARLLPQETLLLLNTDNFTELKQQFKKTSIYKLYNEPAMKAFFDYTKEKWEEKIKEADESDILKAIIDADLLPEGKLTVAFILNQKAVNADQPSFLLISQWGQNYTKILEAVEKMVKKSIDDNTHRKTESYRGVTITSLIEQENHEQELDSNNSSPSTTLEQISSKAHYCFIDDTLIATTDIDVLKFVIAHIKGASSPTLADDSDYIATHKITGQHHDIDIYVNIKQFIKTIAEEDPSGTVKTTMANLGFDNIASFGCAIAFGRMPGGSINTKAFLKINGTKKGVCKMLDAESAAFKPPRFFPDSTCSTTFVNLNIKKAYAELGSILTNFSPQAAALMYMPLLPPGPDGQPAVQLESDIIDHLGSQVIFNQSINKPLSNTSMQSFIALEVNSRTSLEKSLSLLHEKMIAFNNPDAKRELLGHTIYLINLPRVPFGNKPIQLMREYSDQSEQQVPKLAFTVTDSHLIFGMENAIENAIRTLRNKEITPLTSKKWFLAAKSAIPSLTGMTRLENNTISTELLWWMLKQGTKDDGQIYFNFGPKQKGFAELIKPELLPEFDKVRKYFGLSAFYGISRPDGFFFEFKDIYSTQD